MGKTKLVNCAMLILLAGIMFTGCSGGGGNQTPSDDDGRKIIEKTIQENSNGRINLLGFKKTDGQKMEVIGVKVYEMQFEAEIKYV
ncbi:MAG: hypothetical protein HY762_08600, partial [Planctomycetes bacterium]|nr:hypothetical protein [Planctomycetota bacterium]